MKKLSKLIVLVLSAVLAFTMATSCGATEKSSDSGKDPVTPVDEGPQGILTVGYSNFNEKFSPFFAETAYDVDVYTMTSVSLLTSDRTGAIVYKGKTGETIKYNGTDYTYNGIADLNVTENTDGTVYYDFDLRNDVKFSDGVALTADDVIFSMYVLSDPTYDGSSSFFSLPIEGMEAYRAGMDSLLNLIYNAGRANEDYSLWTAEKQTTFWTKYDAATTALAQEIVDYCLANYAAYGAVDVASSAALWGFSIPADGTIADFAAALEAAYGANVSKMINTENAGSSVEDLFPNIEEFSAVGIQTGESASSITGIQKTGDYSLRVVLTEVDATAIYSLGVTVAPLHYYGDTAKYDYANNKFGFDKGDLSVVRAKTTKPLGAGPFKFVSYADGVVRFTANTSYFLGSPKVAEVQFVESTDTEKINGVINGQLDITDPSFNDTVIASIKEANSNNTLYGDKVTISAVDNLGYGYLGMSAHTVKVGDDGSSEASRNLRKALATVFSVYRELSVSSYYHERASVINYPISNTSWAAPQPADEGYEAAFSRDANGNPLYTSSMTADEKYAAALQGALTFFEAAGYTVEGGVVTAAPEGGKMSFKALIPADGEGDHPSFQLLQEAKVALASIGIELNVVDLANSSELWDTINADQAEIWCAAWGASADPDMYQIYFSGDGDKDAGGSNYMYDIDDAQLNQLILDARKTTDQSERKLMYKDCLDIIISWAVEVPVYQRQNVIIFSPERVKMETVTKDITTFYGWMAEIEKLEVVKKA
ncbi:MAG: ABC transporter substrate-binding protein [Clostridia bacterium]|nr:ABC transporter substrate-binding protein [Clostridia bacterium]